MGGPWPLLSVSRSWSNWKDQFHGFEMINFLLRLVALRVTSPQIRFCKGSEHGTVGLDTGTSCRIRLADLNP